MNKEEVLRKIIRKAVKEVIESDDQLKEMVTTLNIDPILTPYAFSAEEEDDEDEKRKKYDVYAQYANRTPEVSQDLARIVPSLKESLENEDLSPTQRLGRSIRTIKYSLREIEKQLDSNLKLTNEAGLNHNQYWRRTQKSLREFSDRLVRILNKVNKLKAQ